MAMVVAAGSAFVLSGYAGLMIGESQQMELLERLGVIVSPD